MAEQEMEVLQVYTNSVRVGAGLYEFVLRFYLRPPEEETQETSENVELEEEKREEIVRIHMSPTHAKALMLLLERNVREYGERFHTIQLPEELIESLTGREAEGEENDTI